MKNLALSHKLSILLGAIAIGWLGSIDIASADPSVFKVDRIQTMKNVKNVKIAGKLTPNDPAGLSFPVYQQTFCRAIEVSLVRGNKKIASTQATGSTISNGCTYELTTGTVQPMVAGKLQIRAISPSSGGYGIDGSTDVSQPLPNRIDLNVSKYFAGPK
jgi:hypothetical protein